MIRNRNPGKDWYTDAVTLMDDAYAQFLLCDQPEAVAAILRGLLGIKGLKVSVSQVQRRVKANNLRGVVFDVYALDQHGNRYNIELQNAPEGAAPERAAYHCAQLVSVSLQRGVNFKLLPKSYVIFVTQRDIWGRGKMLYDFVFMDKADHQEFHDGIHIIYAILDNINPATEAGKVLCDLICSDWRQMYVPELRRLTKFAKTTPEGDKNIMTPAFQKFQRENREMFAQLRKEAIEQGITLGEQNLLQKVKDALDTIDLPDATKAALLSKLAVSD
ncbi:MAG: PD-(D/E)XK nuclease family transposase [Oxalobacter sp.]|nr:PD-(D/E)XK nuclease family transposase [Oxalobacter sp.]